MGIQSHVTRNRHVVDKPIFFFKILLKYSLSFLALSTGPQEIDGNSGRERQDFLLVLLLLPLR